MTVYSTINKNSTTYTPAPRLGGDAILTGSPIGLLLALTYSETILTQYTPVAKNTTSYSTINKN